MRWVEERDIFDKVLVDARACVRVDEGQRVEQLGRLVFDSSELRTRAFFALLCALAQWSGDRIMYYLVLTPDPVSYFLHHFGKYPLLEIQANGSPEEYLTVLNEDPGGSPADAVGINWSQYIILPS